MSAGDPWDGRLLALTGHDQIKGRGILSIFKHKEGLRRVIVIRRCERLLMAVDA